MKSSAVSHTIDRIITTTTQEKKLSLQLYQVLALKVGYYFDILQPYGTGYRKNDTSTFNNNSSKERPISKKKKRTN